MAIENKTLPARLDKVIDDVGVGAVFKRLEDGAMGVFVDYCLLRDPLSDCYVVAMVKKEFREGDELPKGVEDYEFVEVGDEKGWLVLTPGGNEVLIE